MRKTILLIYFLSFIKPTIAIDAPSSPIYKNILLMGDLKGFSDETEVKLTIGDDVFITNDLFNIAKNSGPTELNSRIINSRFRFLLNNIGSPKYATLSLKQYSKLSKALDFRFIIEPGDSIIITNEYGDLRFFGKNAAKYNCQLDISRLKLKLSVPSAKLDSGTINTYISKCDSLAKVSFEILESYKNDIPAHIFSHEKGRIISYYQTMKSSYIVDLRAIHLSKETLDKAQASFHFLINYSNPIWNEKIKKELLNDTNIRNSKLFLNFLYDQYRFDSCAARNAAFNIPEYYYSICKEYSGVVREWLIYQLLSDGRLRKSDSDDIYYAIDLALESSYIKNLWITNLFKTHLLHRPGSQAYNFQLKTDSNKIVRQSDFIGKVVLLDFWYIGCAACIQAKPFTDSIARLFSEDDFRVISICVEISSVHGYYDAWLKAITSGKYTSEANVNVYAPSQNKIPPEIIQRYDIESYPTFILIDKTGKLTKQAMNPIFDNGASLYDRIKEYTTTE